ncbi:GAF domain-containing hybrid sensor histidine kinase/response regulator [Paenibacillus monticola]|uniref:Circadian input-output histidine kinase CikA n=1 Tax=Paenibacillus monticola TaxID=2666075 RepID=A0A7X2KZX4_9BACL|nr:GAF domain-containing hybrid sensor histidine kinase/response regulator [Paenibacillus monticola]MRN51714.1 response regulator [Paenibacillus monticola]
MENTNITIRNMEDAADHMLFLLKHLLRANAIIITVNTGLSEPIQKFYNHEDKFFKETDGVLLLENICQLIIGNDNKALHVIDTHDHPQSPELEFIRELGVRTFVGVPLIFEDVKSYGTICVMDQTAGEYSEDDVRLLYALAIFFTYLIELEQKTDSAEQRIQSKVDLFTMLSHEIRTPMNGIVGMTDLMMTTEMNEQQKYYMEIINESNTRLLEFLNDVLEFSKMEAGKMDIEEEPFDIISTLEETVYLFSTKALEKNLEMILNTDSEIPLYVLGDAQKVRQIIMNLLSNALKFTHEGEIFVELKLLPARNDEEVCVKISIQDTGIGIVQNKLDLLFNEFTQVHDKNSVHHYGGTGLGLAICRHLIELMGGHIEASSELGVGTTFEITLFLKKYSSLPSIPFESDVLAGTNILLVDDNQTSLQVITSMLEDWEVTVASTQNPKQALEWITEGLEFDLVMIDKDMGGVDAITLTAQMRKINMHKRLSVFLLAPIGTNLDDDTKSLFESVIIKPIRKLHLLNAILSLLKHSKSQEE